MRDVERIARQNRDTSDTQNSRPQGGGNDNHNETDESEIVRPPVTGVRPPTGKPIDLLIAAREKSLEGLNYGNVSFPSEGPPAKETISGQRVTARDVDASALWDDLSSSGRVTDVAGTHDVIDGEEYRVILVRFRTGAAPTSKNWYKPVEFLVKERNFDRAKAALKYNAVTRQPHSAQLKLKLECENPPGSHTARLLDGALTIE